MNDSKNSSKGLLVLRYPCDLSQETAERLTQMIAPMADELGVEPFVIGNGGNIRIEKGTDALLERVCAALEEIAAQGRMPEVSEAQIAPQALNARQPSEIIDAIRGAATGLNSRG